MPCHAYFDFGKIIDGVKELAFSAIDVVTEGISKAAEFADKATVAITNGLDQACKTLGLYDRQVEICDPANILPGNNCAVDVCFALHKLGSAANFIVGVMGDVFSGVADKIAEWYKKALDGIFAALGTIFDISGQAHIK